MIENSEQKSKARQKLTVQLSGAQQDRLEVARWNDES